MKRNRTNIFISISAIALTIVFIIQVNWIFETAKIKEDIFNEKTTIILARTTEALSLDKEISKNLETKLGKNETLKIDSLLKHYMNYYSFHVPYSFEVLQAFPSLPLTNSDPNFQKQPPTACYEKSLDEMTNKNNWELKLRFPEKKHFILAEMRTSFITSIVLIVIVLILFWKTFLSLSKEKKISEHTRDFLNNMTHEFKTPLTNIALAGKMIIKDSTIKPEDKIKHYSEIILEENEKLRLQIEQVLSMTALERGEIPIQITKLDVHQLINDALKCMSMQIENKQGNVILNLNAEKFVVMGDKIHLANALCNLIDNAIKYSDEKLEISIQTFSSDKNLILIISDKGIGIEKEYQKKVFHKFFRVPTGDVHNVKGFGLGLAYIKKIIELHKGSIQLNSEGQGTTFTITLPYD